jgi:hypothetical protein
MNCDWVNVYYFRDHCHPWTSVCILCGRCGGHLTLHWRPCTAVWWWRMTATWCPCVGATSLWRSVYNSQASLLSCWKVGFFCEILSNVRLLHFKVRFS